MSIRFDDQVAIVTGASAGLGRSHAVSLAERGAKVVVNYSGHGGSSTESEERANRVVEQILAGGGVAVSHQADVADEDQVSALVDETISKWGRIDILVNNAGIVRDRSFVKMDAAAFKSVIDVNLFGTYFLTQAVWDHMRSRQYGRIVFTSSSSGLYGNFGQANYAAAKAALIGLMNTLVIEGQKYGICVNSLFPVAATPMTKPHLDDDLSSLLDANMVSPAVLFLCDKDAPSGVLLGAGGGVFARTYISETPGVFISPDECSPEMVKDRFAAISHPSPGESLSNANEQGEKYIALARTEG